MEALPAVLNIEKLPGQHLSSKVLYALQSTVSFAFFRTRAVPAGGTNMGKNNNN